MFKTIGIITTVAVILLVAGYFNLDQVSAKLDSLKKLTGNAVEKLPVTTKQNAESIKETTVRQASEQEVSGPKLTERELEAVLEQTPAFKNFPEDGVIVIGFFDGNGKDIKDQFFTIKGGNVEKKYTSNADFIITTGNYWIPKIKESSDFCATFKEIREKQDYRFERNINVLKAGIKYSSFLKYKGCLL